MWTSLGLNQGPPDYESVRINFLCISSNFILNYITLIHRYFVTLHTKSKNHAKCYEMGFGVRNVFATCSQEHRQTHPKVAIDSFKNGRTKDLSQL